LGALLLRGREGREGKGREGKGKEEEGRGREGTGGGREREEGRKGKWEDDCYSTLFLALHTQQLHRRCTSSQL